MHKRLEEIDQLIERWIQQLDVIIPQLLAKLDTDIKQDRFDLVTNVDKAYSSILVNCYMSIFQDINW